MMDNHCGTIYWDQSNETDLWTLQYKPEKNTWFIGRFGSVVTATKDLPANLHIIAAGDHQQDRP